MKKFFQSKGFIVSSLALLCVTILGVCWFVSRDRTGDFRPDESPPSSVTGDWSDGGTQTDGDNGADAYAPGQSTDAEEEYPKVTSQTEDEVVIDFTDTEKPEETLPPVPEGKTEIKDPGQEHTVNPDPSVPEVTAPPAEQAPPSNEPVAKRKYNMDDSILMQIMVEAYPIIVFTKQLEDRSRKIMEIIEGEDYQNGRLIAHSLYKYEVEDNVTDDRGETRVVGHHKKIGLISDSIKKRLLDNGISNKELEEFMQPPKEVG